MKTSHLHYFSNSQGILQIPLALALLAIVSGSVGCWELLRRWRNLAELQLRLDRCTGQTALEFKNTLEKMISSNQKIKAIRASILATQGPSASLSPLQATLIAVVGYQESQRIQWETERVLWISKQKCGSHSDVPLPLPPMDWIRDPPDHLGLQPLRWIGPIPEEFHFEISHFPRAAAAKVYSKGGSIDLPSHWQAEWAPPLLQQLPGSGFY